MIGGSKNLIGKVGFKSKIKCIVGCNPSERIKKQKILIDLKISRNFEKCCDSDKLEDTINYSELKKICKNVSKQEYYLMEKLGYEICKEISLKFNHIEEIKIRLMKKVKKVRYYVELKV